MAITTSIVPAIASCLGSVKALFSGGIKQDGVAPGSGGFSSTMHSFDQPCDVNSAFELARVTMIAHEADGYLREELFRRLGIGADNDACILGKQKVDAIAHSVPQLQLVPSLANNKKRKIADAFKGTGIVPSNRDGMH